MGTNYYIRTNICKCCGRYDEQHIGKKSYGWKFSFFLPEEFNTCSQYLGYIHNVVFNNKGIIFDEYGDPLTFEELKSIVYDDTNGTETGTKTLDKDGFPYNREWFC